MALNEDKKTGFVPIRLRYIYFPHETELALDLESMAAVVFG